MDLNYIRNLTIQKRSKIKHLYAAISLLLVAAIMMSTATYAWLILSTAPAATGVTTTVGANGSLEIALSTADHLTSLSATNMFEEDPFFEYATGEAYHDNVLWGNIVDLADSRYGLNNVILRPSVLNIIENILQVSNPLITVSYGQDGRITYEDNYSGVGAFDPGSQSYQGNKGRDYGVRVAGTPLDAELMQRIEGLASAANLEASTLLSGNTSFLLDVCYYEDTAQTTDTSELRGFLDGVLALNGTYQNAVEAIDAAFGSEAADPEADALLKEIQENYQIANEKLKAADAALKQLEPEVKEGEETPEPVALTMAAAHEIIAPLFGELKLYTKEYAEDGRTFEWIPVTGAIPTNQAVRIELGQDSYFQLLGALSGSYAMSGEYPSSSAGQGSNTTGSAEWTAVIEDYSQVFKLESETMASKYEIYLEEYETYSKQLNTYADKMQNLVNREYQDEVRFFYEYALHPLPDPETGLPDETTQPFTPAELEAYVSAIDGRVDELEEIVTFLEDYTKSAVMVYASSGAVDRQIYLQTATVALNADASVQDYLDAVGLAGNSNFNAVRSTCETARNTIAAWRLALENLDNDLNPKDEEGNIIPSQVRDMNVEDLLKAWDHIENISSMTIADYDHTTSSYSTYTADTFADNANDVFVNTIKYIQLSANEGIYGTLAHEQGSILDHDAVNRYAADTITIGQSTFAQYAVQISSDVTREKSNTQYMSGNNVAVFTYEYNRTRPYLSKSLEVIQSSLVDISDSSAWVEANTAAEQAEAVFMDSKIPVSVSSTVADLVLENIISGESNGYSSAYYERLGSMLTSSEDIFNLYEDALAKQILLFTAGLAEREAIENEKKEKEAEVSGTVADLSTKATDTHSSASAGWNSGNWTFDELCTAVEWAGNPLSEEVLCTYHALRDNLQRARESYQKLQNGMLSWDEIDSVLTYFTNSIPASLIRRHFLYASVNGGLFADVKQILTIVNAESMGSEIRNEEMTVFYDYVGLPPDVDVSHSPIGYLEHNTKQYSRTHVNVTNEIAQIEYLIDRTEDAQGNTLSDREFVFRNETLQMDSTSTLAQQYYGEYAQTESDLLHLLYRCGLSHANITPEQDKTKYSSEDITDAETALGKLSKAVDAAMECLVHTLRASAASSSTDESTYQKAIQFNTPEELLKALNLTEGNVLYDLHQDLSSLEDDIESAAEGLGQARTKLNDKTATEGVLTQQVFATLAPVQELKLNGMAIPDFRNLIANLDAPYMVNGENYGGWTVAQMLSNRGVSFASSNGALSMAHSLFGTAATVSSTYKAEPITVGTKDRFVSDVAVSMATDIAVSGSLNNSVSWVYASGAPSEPSASGGNSDSNYIIGNTYAVAIDFLLRTNANGANLLLQTDGIQRIYSDDTVRNNDRYDAEEIEAMQGKGSFIQLYNDDPRDAKAWDVLQNPAAEEDLVMAAKRQLGSEIMEALRIAFVDTLTGEVYAYAKADWLDFDYEDRTITAELELVDEHGYEIPNAILKPLVQNQVSAISAWLYLDGTEVSNSSVDSEKLGALTMNLQFATDAFLNPAYSENKGTTITPPQLDQPEATSPVPGDEFYVESNGSDTYSIYTLNSAGARDYEMTFTGSMDADNQTVVINKVTAYPNGGVVIPALATYAADQEEYAIAIDPTQKPFADLGTENAAVFFTAVDGKKVSVTEPVLTNLFGRNEGTDFVSLNLSGLDTSTVTNMSGLFEGCSGLTELDISGIDTSKVTNMSYMFSGCSRLTSLGVSGFDTSKVTDMDYMFCDCSGLTELSLSNFNTSNVNYMRSVFNGCSGLRMLDLSNFDTTNVITMNGMFYECCSLLTLDLKHFNTTNVTNMGVMFSRCSNLNLLDVSRFETKKVTDMSGMFARCTSLSKLNISNFDTENVTHMGQMFSDCSSLSELDVSSFNTINVMYMGGMFYNCSNLTELDISRWDMTNVADTTNMFYNCPAGAANQI